MRTRTSGTIPALGDDTATVIMLLSTSLKKKAFHRAKLDFELACFLFTLHRQGFSLVGGFIFSLNMFTCEVELALEIYAISVPHFNPRTAGGTIQIS